MEGTFQIFLFLTAVLAGTAWLARRIDIAPAILLLLAGIALAFLPGMPMLQLPPELVLLVVLRGSRRYRCRCCCCWQHWSSCRGCCWRGRGSSSWSRRQRKQLGGS